MFRLTTSTSDTLTEAQRAAIVALCVATHDDEAFRDLFAFVAPDTLHILAYDDAALVAHAMVGTRWVQPAPHPPLRTAYVDAVAVSPTAQGQGVGRRLMARLADEVAADYELACLESEEAWPFYERCGWERWRGPLAGRGAQGRVPTPDQEGIMILRLPATPPLDLDGSLSIEIEGRIW